MQKSKTDFIEEISKIYVKELKKFTKKYIKDLINGTCKINKIPIGIINYYNKKNQKGK